jgi:NAD(P)-dependent dehydrogenase (short-subunit alcohol dehydrogenase family)
MKHEILQMLHQGSGAIVNTASIMGLVGSWSGTSAYNASKHGVVGLTKTASLEYARVGIRVNAVCPSYIRAPLIDRALLSRPEMEEQIVARHPVGRMGKPEEIVEAMVWLCSDMASFITGHTMTVDGGYVAQ